VGGGGGRNRLARLEGLVPITELIHPLVGVKVMMK
jgi:hypothetical protein